jgi:tight adherence protein C
MQIAALSALVFVYTLILSVCWRGAKNADHLAGRLDAVAKIGAAQAQAEANDLSKPFGERFLKPAAQGFVRWLANHTPSTENARLANKLKIAGVRMKPAEYVALRRVVGLCTGMIGILVMDYVLRVRTRKRKFLLQRQMPEVLDLLSVSVEAGLGFDASLQRMSGRLKGPLIDELDTTYREITLGRPRAEALRNFEQRCGLEEIKSFVSSIIQAEQLGISLKNVLKSQAQQMRLIKKQRVEEKAMKAPVKIIMPLVFFVFPVVFIILLGPAVIQILGMKELFG